MVKTKEPIVKERPTYRDMADHDALCPVCLGTGEVRAQFCRQCWGWGWVAPQDAQCIHEFRSEKVAPFVRMQFCTRGCGRCIEVDTSG